MLYPIGPLLYRPLSECDRTLLDGVLALDEGLAQVWIGHLGRSWDEPCDEVAGPDPPAAMLVRPTRYSVS